VAGVHLCKGPPLLGFCFFVWGRSSNYVGSESGQIQSVKLLSNMVSIRTQHPPPPLPAIHCLYILYLDTRKGEGGGVEPEKKVRGTTVQNSDKHRPQSPFTGKFF
jgi:hypothetical protein